MPLPPSVSIGPLLRSQRAGFATCPGQVHAAPAGEGPRPTPPVSWCLGDAAEFVRQAVTAGQLLSGKNQRAIGVLHSSHSR